MLSVPVGPRPCSRVGPLTHWESHADSHKDEHRQNYNLPTGDLQPGRMVTKKSVKMRQASRKIDSKLMRQREEDKEMRGYKRI